MVSVRIRKHEAVPQTGSYEVYFDEGRPSVYFYWDDVAGRRLGPDQLTCAEALEQARAFARAELARYRETAARRPGAKFLGN
jgi:hypothetical protein